MGIDHKGLLLASALKGYPKNEDIDRSITVTIIGDGLRKVILDKFQSEHTLVTERIEDDKVIYLIEPRHPYKGDAVAIQFSYVDSI